MHACIYSALHIVKHRPNSNQKRHESASRRGGMLLLDRPRHVA